MMPSWLAIREHSSHSNTGHFYFGESGHYHFGITGIIYTGIKQGWNGNWKGIIGGQ
jgi:hypothetical protein